MVASHTKNPLSLTCFNMNFFSFPYFSWLASFMASRYSIPVLRVKQHRGKAVFVHSKVEQFPPAIAVQEVFTTFDNF